MYPLEWPLFHPLVANCSRHHHTHLHQGTTRQVRTRRDHSTVTVCMSIICIQYACLGPEGPSYSVRIQCACLGPEGPSYSVRIQCACLGPEGPSYSVCIHCACLGPERPSYSVHIQVGLLAMEYGILFTKYSTVWLWSVHQTHKNTLRKVSQTHRDCD